MSLEKELQVYKRERWNLIHAGWLGKWAVIKHEEIMGPYLDIEAAIEAGYEKYGLDEIFMARQVAEHDPIITASRRVVSVPRDE